MKQWKAVKFCAVCKKKFFVYQDKKNLNIYCKECFDKYYGSAVSDNQDASA